jgi:sec-independent protein translocase protein TatA
MMGMGIWEWVVILVIILIIFGAGKIPEIGDALGKGIRNFRKSVKEPEEDDKDTSSDTEKDSDLS